MRTPGVYDRTMTEHQASPTPTRSTKPRAAVLGFSVAALALVVASASALFTQSCAESPPAKEPTTDVPPPDLNAPPTSTAASTATTPPSAAPVVPPPVVAPPVT